MSEAAEQIEFSRSRRFRPYAEYKDSGIKWLGELPAHWRTKRLKFLLPARTGKLGTKPDDAVYVGLEHVESWTGRLQLETQPDSVDSVVSSFAAGDVLFGKLRPYLAKVARPDFDGVCTSEILPLRPASECFQSYMMYCLLNAPYIRWLDSLTYGAKMPRVSPDQVGSSHAALPPMSEQRAIAEFLDRETANIDALVAKMERLIKLLQEKRTALITRAVTRGLDRNVLMKDSGVESLGEIPAHWDAGALSRWWTVLDCKHQTVPFLDEGMPVASIGEVHGLSVDLSDANRTSIEEYERMIEGGRAPGIGDIIYSRNATVGEAAIVDNDDAFCMGQDVSLIRSVFDQPLFLLHTLRSRAVLAQLEALMVGSTFKRINVGQIKKFFIAVPPKSEQEDIAQYAQGVYDATASLIDRVREAVDILREFRTALISAAVTGKIDVREAMPG